MNREIKKREKGIDKKVNQHATQIGEIEQKDTKQKEKEEKSRQRDIRI